MDNNQPIGNMMLDDDAIAADDTQVTPSPFSGLRETSTKSNMPKRRRRDVGGPPTSIWTSGSPGDSRVSAAGVAEDTTAMSQDPEG